MIIQACFSCHSYLVVAGFRRVKNWTTVSISTSPRQSLFQYDHVTIKWQLTQHPLRNAFKNNNSCIRMIDSKGLLSKTVYLISFAQCFQEQQKLVRMTVANHWVVLQPYKQTKPDRILWKSMTFTRHVCSAFLCNAIYYLALWRGKTGVGIKQFNTSRLGVPAPP